MADLRSTLTREYHQQVKQHGDRPSPVYILLARLRNKQLPFKNIYEPFKPHEWHPFYSEPEAFIMSPAERYDHRLLTLPVNHHWYSTAWVRALDFWNEKCAVCGASRYEFTIVRDHLVPVSHRDCPGTVPSNLIPLCLDCNKRKLNQDLSEWLMGGNVAACDLLLTVRQIWRWQVEICPQNRWN